MANTRTDKTKWHGPYRNPVVTATEMHRHFFKILREVEAGAIYSISKYGKIVAVIMSHREYMYRSFMEKIGSFGRHVPDLYRYMAFCNSVGKDGKWPEVDSHVWEISASSRAEAERKALEKLAQLNRESNWKWDLMDESGKTF